MPLKGLFNVDINTRISSEKVVESNKASENDSFSYTESEFGSAGGPASFEQGDSLNSLLAQEPNYTSIFSPTSSTDSLASVSSGGIGSNLSIGTPTSGSSLQQGFSFNSLASFSTSALGTMSALSSTIQAPSSFRDPAHTAAGNGVSFSAPAPGFMGILGTAQSGFALKGSAPQSSASTIKRKKKTTGEQLSTLTAEFDANMNPSSERRQELAEKLMMTPRAVQIWFQNKRAKARLELKRNKAAAVAALAGRGTATSLLSEGIARGRSSRRNSVGSLNTRTPPGSIQNLNQGLSRTVSSDNILTPVHSNQGTPSIPHEQTNMAKLGAAGSMLDSLFAAPQSSSSNNMDVLPTPIPSPLMTKDQAAGLFPPSAAAAASTQRNDLLMQLGHLLNPKPNLSAAQGSGAYSMPGVGNMRQQLFAQPSQEDVEKVNMHVVQELSHLVRCGLDVTALLPLLTHPLDYQEKLTAVQLLRVLHRALSSAGGEQGQLNSSLSAEIEMKRKQHSGINGVPHRAESLPHIFKPQINTKSLAGGSFGSLNAVRPSALAGSSKSVDALLSPSINFTFPSASKACGPLSASHDNSTELSSGALSYSRDGKPKAGGQKTTSFSLDDSFMNFHGEPSSEHIGKTKDSDPTRPSAAGNASSTGLFDEKDNMYIDAETFEFLNT